MNGKIRCEHVFLVCALVFGLLLVFLTPPMNVPDEGAHFLNAYAVSKGHFFGEIVDGEFVRKVPQSVSDFEARYSNAFAWKYDAKTDYSDVVNEIRSTNEPGETVTRGGVIVCPTGYLVSGAGMALGSLVGRLFAASQPYNLMLYGRVANLLFCILVTYAALKIIPCFKRTLLLLATMPMTLFLGASLNYDAVLIPVSFLFVAIVARLICRKQENIQPKEIGVVLFCVFFLVGVKQAYAPLLLMLLAVPKKKYGGLRNMILCISAVIAVAVIAYIPQLIHNRTASMAAGDIYSGAVEQQSEWIRSNAAKLPGIFFNTLKTKIPGYIESFWGILGVLDTPFPKPFVIMGLVVLFVTALMDVCSFSLYDAKEWWKRLLPFFAAIIAFAGMMYIMYKEWTPLPGVANTIGGDIAEGIQGRYLIPLVLPLCAALANKFSFVFASRIKLSAEKRTTAKAITDHFIYFWALFCGLLTVLTVMLRYWI